MWIPFSTANKAVFIPGVGQKVNRDSYRVRVHPARTKYHPNSTNIPEEGGNIVPNEFRAKSDDLISVFESNDQYKDLEKAKEIARSKETGGFGKESSNGHHW